MVGRGGSDLHPNSAEGHKAGYTILVAWSARDLQRAEMALRLGPAKGKDSATTLGPFSSPRRKSSHGDRVEASS